MAFAIVAQKLNTKVAHIETGIRSGDWTMPEEINRLVTDSITNYFFTTSRTANEHLKASGINNDNIYFVGNTMIDRLLKQRTNFKQPEIWKSLNLSPNSRTKVVVTDSGGITEETTIMNVPCMTLRDNI
jgi:UDP-N-acetylglucosamine 2-epimerase (non-hydrolysing)